MKTTKAHYNLFKSECKKWINRFDLSGFEFRFNWIDIDAKAEVSLDQCYSGVYTVDFSRDIEGGVSSGYIKRMAKHEMIHCLIGELSECGFKRFISRDDFDKVEEKLTNKLEKLIN